MNRGDQIRKWIPGFFPLALVLVLGVNLFVFFGTRLLNTGREHVSMWMKVDDIIPFLPAFVFIYFLAFIQWIAGWLLLAREGRSAAAEWYASDIIGKLLAGVCFLILPTCIIRPAVSGSSLADQLTRFLFRIDEENNLFPSIHCLESWACLRSAWQMKRVSSWYRPASLVMTLLVFASTVCLKQHVFVDIIGGILFFEIGRMIENKTHLLGPLLSKVPSLW